jgi:hypothetical protein
MTDSDGSIPEETNESCADNLGPTDSRLVVAITNSQHTSEFLNKATDIFESIGDVVENLTLLSPSLDRPYPEDVDVYSSGVSENGDQEVAVALARQTFPSASNTLQSRLGRANWKRQIVQKFIQQQNHTARAIGKYNKGHKFPKRNPRQEMTQDAFNFQKPTLRDVMNQQKLSRVPPSVHSSTAPTEMTDTVDAASIFSKPILPRIVSSTTIPSIGSFAASSKARKPTIPPAPLPALVEAQFPKIPISLENLLEIKNRFFTCNLCGYELEAGNTIKIQDDWHQHVLEDIEPYLCTFDECFSAQEMYAARDDWYKHELETHRIKKVWPCAACMKEFSTKELAESHLEEHRDELEEADIDMMKAMLRQSRSSKHLNMQMCPLCLERLQPKDTKSHIARHLEQFALLSVNDDHSEDEDDSDEIFSQTNDDAMSDRGRKETVLNTFVTEQLKLNLERGKQPPDRYLEGEGDLDLLEDMSDAGGSNDNEPRINDHHRGSNDLIQRMFHGQHDTATQVSGGSKRLQRPTLATGPPSSSSSNHSLPLLRTWSFPRNEDFMGRDKELANLYKILSEPGRVCVVSAEGGMGKTALAVEFSWRYEHCYHYVFWIQAETPVGSSDTFCQIALQMGLAPDGTGQDTLIRLGREFLEQIEERRWLLVFDNVDRWDDIDVYTPSKTSATNGSILITTRHESLTAPSRPVNYFRITLQELDMEEGRKLLLHGLPADLKPQELSLRDPEYKIAGEIAKLAGLPLLIIYISGYVKQSGCTLEEFWEYWNEWRAKARIVGGVGDSRDLSGRESVFYIALRDLGEDARKVLKIIAFLDSDGIQKELLVRNDTNKPGPPYLKQNR